ncbi:MAG: bifunctional diaminohydroxyphosphoribosylaminopyrimidine deaminase/5-amino-6-(5-phosphoribosylamino)uracil reductase RibD [Bifidobacteriaceae bacterium]|jgi:diaminohydroxyphosphoribosylaminopyrimidine deaminase/5-amino-6-(5-phosphoribosylamino)uracil reductase|nr:bifunctional diaminohydroxyphosphoribosylaminopyrimidine deaminase/5-amino-6-(5-phosphoribosylamino)uracil reductase RibD [Bifidobacteriaceae bacterium]
MDALARAFELAALGPVYGPNPRVGCVITAPDGAPLGEGYHHGAGHPHAEVEALADAAAKGHDVTGATAWVTLEPCNHQGRTGPCSVALAEAGVAKVVYAMADPNPVAGGGDACLRGHGVETVAQANPTEAAELNQAWLFAVTHGRPLVTLKLATSLDGYIAGADGASRWITGEPARAYAHAIRAQVDAIAVGTGTIYADDPALTARGGGGTLAEHQPLRVVVGHRPIPEGAAIGRAGAPPLHVATHDPAVVLAELQAREVRHLLVEGGATLATAFLEAGLVDRLNLYLGAVLLGAGLKAIGPLGVTGLVDAPRWVTRAVRQLGDDVLIDAAREAETCSPVW